MKINMRRSKMSFLPIPGQDTDVMKSEQYGQAVAVGGIIYMLPKRQNHVLKIDTANDTLTKIEEVIERSGSKWEVAIAMGIYIYGIPLDAKRVLKIDTSSDNISLIGEKLGV